MPEFPENTGSFNLQYTIDPPNDADIEAKSAMLSRPTNGNAKSFNGDVIDTSEKNAENHKQESNPKGMTQDRYNISKSYDNLSPPIRGPMKDVEMTIMKADSTDVHTGYIVMENTKDGLVLQLRPQSVEMDILPSNQNAM